MAESHVGRKDQLIDLTKFIVGYSVRMISVAILVATVERCIIPKDFVVLYKRISFIHLVT